MLIVIVLIGALLWGLPSAIIANSKGRSFFLWWLYGLALPIAAIPHSCVVKHAEPDWRERPWPSGVSRPAKFAAPTRQVYEERRRKCPECAEMIMMEAKVCRFCRAIVEPIPPEPKRLLSPEERSAQYWEKRTAQYWSDWGPNGWKRPDKPGVSEPPPKA